VISVFVCLSVCSHSYIRNFTKFPLHVTCMAVDRSSTGDVRSNMLCISGIVDDVMFSYDESSGGVTIPQQPRCNGVKDISV